MTREEILAIQESLEQTILGLENLVANRATVEFAVPHNTAINLCALALVEVEAMLEELPHALRHIEAHR